MAIFSRRIIQRLLDENKAFLSRGQIKKHVSELNKMDKTLSLAFEWEVVLLNALSKVGKVVHEKDFGGTSFADVYFESPTNPEDNFVADITSVSDKGLNEMNPYDILWDQLMQKTTVCLLRQNSFSLHVGNITEQQDNGAAKVRLKLPGRSRFSQLIFNSDFDNFLSSIAECPDKPSLYTVKTDDTDVTIGYNPNQEFGSGGYASYTAVFSLTNNIVYCALERKLDQLRRTGFKGILGIFLCDGDCSFINNRGTPSWSPCTLDKVINHFLRHNTDISFIIVFSLKGKQLLCNFYGGKLFDKTGGNIMEFLKKFVPIIPMPERDAGNAINLLKRRNPSEGESNRGGHTVNAGENVTKIKISARELLDLLAGTIDQQKFFESHGFIPSHRRASAQSNFFEVARKSGQLIREITMERSESEDDDWIIFKLEGPDPAISPFIS